MDMSASFSFEEVPHIVEGDTILYFLHTIHGRRYSIFKISRQRSHSKYTLTIAQMWLVLMKAMGFELIFPSNINTPRCAEQFLNSFLQGLINFNLGSISNRRTELEFPKCMHLHLLQHNKEQLDLPEAHGDGIERQPAEDGEATFIPAMSSINLDVGLTTLAGCRTLAIDFIEFCNDESILSNFIFWTESEGDSVDVRHGTFTLTFINVGDFINYDEQHAFLRRILCRHRNVIRYLVFFNYEVGEVHLIAFDKCGMEIMTDYLYDFTIEEYANADAGL
nr:hypothetical protein Iba_chr14bCG10900 [Ipomoea batatas]